jgi:hypothetical protein
MFVLELFKGTGSIGKACARADIKVISLDNEKISEPDILIDFMEWDYKSFLQENKDKLLAVWASPPCTTYSLAARGVHRKEGIAVSSEAKLADRLIDRLLDLVNSLPSHVPWFIENPRGKLSIDGPTKTTIFYCQYGTSYMKPTNIWSNSLYFLPTGTKCSHKKHTGKLHDLPTKWLRYAMPEKLCDEIINSVIKENGCHGSIDALGSEKNITTDPKAV